MRAGIRIDPVGDIVFWRSIRVRPDMSECPIKSNGDLTVPAEILACYRDQPCRLRARELAPDVNPIRRQIVEGTAEDARATQCSIKRVVDTGLIGCGIGKRVGPTTLSVEIESIAELAIE